MSKPDREKEFLPMILLPWAAWAQTNVVRTSLVQPATCESTTKNSCKKSPAQRSKNERKTKLITRKRKAAT